MGQATRITFEEDELSALNAKANALAKRDVGDWEEAVDWGVPDYTTLCALEWRVATSPDFE